MQSLATSSAATIVGLTGAKRLNGQRAVLLKFVAAKERWAVRLVSSGERVLVRPQNLEPYQIPAELAEPVLCAQEHLHALAKVHLVGHQDGGQLARPGLKRGSGIGGQRVAASSRAPGAGGVPAPRVQGREPLCLRCAGSSYAALAPPTLRWLRLRSAGSSYAALRRPDDAF